MSEYKEKQAAQALTQIDVAVAPDADAASKPKGAGRSEDCLGGDDFWRCARGAFRVNGGEGSGIYEYGGVNYSHHLTLWDCEDVGIFKGWTYRATGFQFVIFLSRVPASNGKFKIFTSHDNENFHHYCWAD